MVRREESWNNQTSFFPSKLWHYWKNFKPDNQHPCLLPFCLKKCNRTRCNFCLLLKRRSITDKIVLCESICHHKVPRKKHQPLYMGTHHWLPTRCLRLVEICPSVAGLRELTPESLTCALDRCERTALYHTLRASGSRKPEEGSPKRMNRGI